MIKNILLPLFFGTIFIGCNSLIGPEDSNPKLLWKQYLDGQASSGFVTDDDYLYFQTSYSYGQPEHLFKVKKDGSSVKKYNCRQGATDGVPVIYNDMIYTGSDDGAIYALKKDNLELVWSKQGMFIWTTCLSVDESNLYVTEENKVHAFNRITGDKVWSTEMSGRNPYNSRVDGDRLYFATGLIFKQDGYLYCIDKQNGKIIYQKTLPYMESRGQWGGAGTGVEIWNDYIYVPSFNRNLYCFNKNDGSLVWEFLADSPMETPPRVSDGILYIGSLNRTCYAIDAATGKQIWSYQTVGSIRRDPPQFYSDKVMFMSGAMLIFNKKDGKLIADFSSRTGDDFGYWNAFWDKDGKIYSTGYEEKTQKDVLLSHQF